HIFHTSDERVWRYVNAFAGFGFNGFVNRPKALARGRLYSFPINLLTLHQVFGVTSPAQARELLARERESVADPQANMEAFCLSTIGRRLYELFIEGYTRKQWGRHPRELPAAIIKRVPVRLDCNDNYYRDRWQGIPRGGYSLLIQHILGRVRVETGVDFAA